MIEQTATVYKGTDLEVSVNWDEQVTFQITMLDTNYSFMLSVSDAGGGGVEERERYNRRTG